MALILPRLPKVIITKLVNILKKLIKLIRNKNMIKQNNIKYMLLVIGY